MQRVASSTRGSTSAPVGQASRQRVQVPQWSVGSLRSCSRARSVKTVPMKKNDPAPGRISIVFLPIQPSPARRARARSGTGPESAKVWAIRAPWLAQEIRQRLQPRARNSMVVFASGVSGDLGRPGPGSGAPS